MEEGFDIDAFTSEVEVLVNSLEGWNPHGLVPRPTPGAAAGAAIGVILGPLGTVARSAALISGSVVWREPMYRSRLRETKEKLGKETQTDEDFVVEMISKEKEARSILNSQVVKQALCPYLQPISGEVSDIAKAVTAAMIPLQVAGQLNIRLEPLLFAMVAVILTKIGIAKYCLQSGLTADD